MRIERVRPVTGAAFALMVSAFFLFVPPIAQDQAYHLFADSRTLWDVPNFWNVASNLPFAVVGILGLWKLRGVFDRVLFTGVLLTFFGSAYYHLAPSDARLVWDRLPMTLVFMALLACVVKANDWLLAMFLACGVASVLWWSMTGDLRFLRTGAVRPASDSHPRAVVRSRRSVPHGSLDFLCSRQARRILRSRGLF
jgi:hypothetical protein